MRKITLNTVQRTSPNYKKYFALVDDEDFDKVSKYNWCVIKMSHTCYAQAEINGKPKYLHNFIMRDTGIDHIDNNGLNNLKSNLRKATQHQNLMNMSRKKNSSNRFKGIRWHKANKVWIASITYNYKTQHLGCFKTDTEAAIAYNTKAKELFGEYANLNKV